MSEPQEKYNCESGIRGIRPTETDLRHSIEIFHQLAQRSKDSWYTDEYLATRRKWLDDAITELRQQRQRNAELKQQLAIVQRVISETCPIGGLDIVTTLQTQKQALQQELAEALKAVEYQGDAKADAEAKLAAVSADLADTEEARQCWHRHYEKVSGKLAKAEAETELWKQQMTDTAEESVQLANLMQAQLDEKAKSLVAAEAACRVMRQALVYHKHSEYCRGECHKDAKGNRIWGDPIRDSCSCGVNKINRQIQAVLATTPDAAFLTRYKAMEKALEAIIQNRIADGGPCDRRAGCDCSECIAREALKKVDHES